jgi:hypothetical protein
VSLLMLASNVGGWTGVPRKSAAYPVRAILTWETGAFVSVMDYSSFWWFSNTSADAVAGRGRLSLKS